MKFLSETERLAHSQARLIPYSLWSSVFDKELSDELIPLMQPDEPSTVQLSQIAATIESDTRKKQRVWLAIALSHPHLSNESLYRIATTLNLPEEELFSSAIKLGNIDFFNLLLSNFSHKKLKKMIKADDYLMVIPPKNN